MTMKTIGTAIPEIQFELFDLVKGIYNPAWTMIEQFFFDQPNALTDITHGKLQINILCLTVYAFWIWHKQRNNPDDKHLHSCRVESIGGVRGTRSRSCR